MKNGVRRPKRPELVKALLLDAGAQLLVHGEQLSIGAVAEIADVTKGAVQHHFPTREALVMALYDHLVAEFQDRVADDGSGIQAASALRRGSMFDVMEQQRCYAAGQSP
jgi:AcrR family transcriptional regulator